MTFTLRDIRRTLDAFENSTWKEIHLCSGGFELRLSTEDPGGVDLTDRDVPDHTGRDNLSDESVETSDKSTPVDKPAPVAGHAAPSGPVTHVTAPSVGIFWRSPRPGAPPFADVGDQVEPGTTLCIVEVMKLMNHVKAEISGRVVEVLVGNGEAVEQGQPLFAVASDG